MKSMLSAKLNFEKKLSSQNNSKIYKYIQSLTSTLSLPSTISFDSLSASSDTEKANLFNYFFYSVFTQSSLSMPSPDQLPLPSATETLSNISISEDDVYTTLFSLDTTKSMGVDGIGPKSLRTVQWDSINLYTIYLCLASHNVMFPWNGECI